MTAEVTERTAQLRGVNVRWADVIVAGHTVEQVLSFDVAEAEAVGSHLLVVRSWTRTAE